MTVKKSEGGWPWGSRMKKFLILTKSWKNPVYILDYRVVQASKIFTLQNFTFKFKFGRLNLVVLTGMNLQICFMNETASDGSDSENPKEAPEVATAKMSTTETKSDPYTSLPIIGDQKTHEMDFFAKQAKLQTEARTALTQAKELARVQMQVERQQRKHNRISDLVRQSLKNVGETAPYDNMFFNFAFHLVGDSVSLGVSPTESSNSDRDEHRSITSYCQWFAHSNWR